MNEAEKKQKERLQKLVNGDIPNLGIQLSYEGKPKNEEERKAEYEQFIARVNIKRQQNKKGRISG